MQVIDWNVLVENRQLQKGLQYIRSLDPEIVCLQEYPSSKMSLLADIFTGYDCNSQAEFIDIRSKKATSYLITLTKIPINVSSSQLYSDADPRSLLNKLIYQKVYSRKQKFFYSLVKLHEGGQEFAVANMHLPCSNGARERIAMLESVLASLAKVKMPMFVCGDFNIVSGRLFNLLSGWTRGFALDDYSIKERKEADSIISRHGFSNCFDDVNTITSRLFGRQQFDHILLSKHFRLLGQTLHANFGSDHLILEAEVAFAGS